MTAASLGLRAAEVCPEKLRFNTMIEEIAFRVQKVSPTADMAYAGNVESAQILRGGIMRLFL